MNLTIDDAAARRMLERLESGESFKAGLRAMATYLHGKITDYPPTSGKRPPQAFVSEKQRRYFFAALRDGRITLPYRRTKELNRSFGDGPIAEDGGLTQVIGTNLGYAPYVVGAGSQSGYMRSLGWKTTADVVEAEGDHAFRTFSAGFRQSMQGRG